MTGRRRTVLLWGGALAVGALLLFTFGYFPQEILREQVERRLQEALGPGSSIRRMHVVPGRLSTDVYGLVIEGPTYRLTAPRARLVLAPGFLWGGSLEFRTVELEQPVLEMWEGPPSEKRPPVDRRLVVSRLHVAGGSVVYRSGSQGTFVVRNLALDGSVGSGTLTIRASGGEWRRDPTVALGPVAGVARLSSSLDIAIESLTATVAGSEVRISGTLGRAGDLKPDLTVDADLALADLGLFGAPEMRGRGSVKGTVKGLGDDLAIEGDVDAEDVRVAGWPVDRLQGRIERTAGPRGRTFADVTATLLGGRAEGKVELVRGGVLDADIRLQSIRTARLREQGIDLGVPFDGLVSGRVTLKGTTDSAAVEADLTASGTAAGRRMTAALDAGGRASVDRRSVDVRYTLKLDAGGAGGGPPRIDDLHLVARGTAAGALPPVVSGTYEGTVVLATTGGAERVPVSGRFRTARGATTFTLAARALGGTLDASGDLRGSVARRLVATGRAIDLRRLHDAAGGLVGFRLDASGPLDRLTGTADLDVADLTWNGGRIGPLTARVVGTAGAGRVTLAIPELHASGQGTFDRRALRATLRLEETPLERLAALSPPPDPITGTTSGTVDMTVPFASPDAVVIHARLDALDVVRGRLAARAVRPFSARYQARTLSLEGLEMAGEGVTLSGDASFGLDPAAPVEGMIRFDLDLARLPTREGFTVTGRAAGDVELTGTRTRPRAYGTVNVTGVEVRDVDSALLTLADGQIDLAGDAANVPGLRAEVPGGFLELAGRVPLAELLPEPAARALGLEAAGPIQARLRFDVDLGRITVRPPWHVDGRAQGDVELVGPRARPRAYGAITLTDVYAEHPAAPPLQIPDARIELNGDEAQIPGLRATIADGVLDVEGRIPMGALLSPDTALKIGVAPGGEADVKATLTGVQAATLLEILNPDRPSRVRALLTGEARLLGTLTSWREAHGEVRLAATEVTVQDLAMEVTPLVARLEAGRVDFDPLEIRARGGVFVADGSADLFARTIDVTGRGTLDLRTVSPFLEEGVLTGDAEVDVAVRGALDAPRPTGTVAVRNGTLRLGVIRQPLTAIAGTLVLDEGLIRLDQVTAMLGGGPVRMQGTARWAGLGIADTQVSITGEGLGIRYPVARGGGRAGQLFEELKARVNADLTLTGRTGDFLLAGKVTAERSLYDSDIFLDEGLLPPDIPPAVEDEDGGSRLLQTVGLDVEVSTENPFMVRNNLAQLEAEGTLRLRGSMDEPAPFGRFDVRPGGKVFLQEREFAIQSGRIAWNGTTDPEIAITGTTVIGQPDGDYQITVVANGPLETPALTLRSTPALSEREIASLIATGRSDVALNSGAWVVGEQAAALLAGRFTRAVAKELMDLGLDQVDIQPELLAREGEPSARFTFGKNFGRTLRLIYSTSLSDPELHYYQALFRFREGMELSAKLQRRFDGTFTYSLGQRLRFGASGAPPREAREFDQVELTAVTVEGGLRDFPAAVAEAGAKPGSKITYWDLLDDADRIREELVRQGHIEAVIDARLDGTQAVFGGDVGPRYRWRVEGMASPPDLTPEIEAALFEEEAVERGRERLLSQLRAAGHLRASAEASSVPENGWRTLVFRVDPGPVLQADVAFPGATLFTPVELTDAAGGAAALLTRPRDAERAIRAAYREKHRLAAKIGPVQTAEQPGRVTVTVPVDEGPAARIAEVEYRGSTLERATLDALSRIAVGTEYDPVATSAGLRNIRDQYLTKGFPAVRVVSRLEPVGTDLRLVYVVAEGPRILVGNVEIVGLRRTRRSLVEKQIDLPPGEPLDTRKLALLERRLSELGIFRRVVVSALPGTPATIRVEVEEDARFLAAYDVRYNSEENFTGLVDGEMRNVLGLGVAVGGRIRAGRDLREFRASVTAPSFLWGGDDLTASAYHLSEFQRVALELPPTVGDLTKIGLQPAPLARLNAEGRKREMGFQAQQAVHMAHPWDLLYGYRFKRTTCPGQGIPPLSRDRDRRRLYDPCETPLIRVGGDFSQVPDKTVDISGLDSSVVRDTRDAPLNPTRGTFLSLNVLAAPHFLGSDFDFTREFAHFSLIRKLGRSPFAWAHGYRMGLIQVYDKQRLPFDDLFKTGGPNTIRGYEIDTVGPLGPSNEALGGEALIVVNQELRYQHDRSGLGGAVFWDIGNVFAKARDIDFDFLHSAGVGVRYSSPFGLLRLDIAFPLKQRPGDRWYQINFGLGQAF